MLRRGVGAGRADGVELERFAGKWFEIAKLPRLTQANCTATTASYTLRQNVDIGVLSRMREQKFDVDRLEYTLQP